MQKHTIKQIIEKKMDGLIDRFINDKLIARQMNRQIDKRYKAIIIER